MPKVQFIFALHNHQPVGNFEFVIEEAYQKSYLPFINVLGRHPKIKIVLHYTGVLYHFFEQRHPEFIDILKRLVAEGRVEILSGGLYEPIISILTDEDKIGQIRVLSNYIRRTVGYDARGMWLAERVWEPHLPKCIVDAGISHVVVDDFHFKMAGLRDDELDGYYLTEEQNSLVCVFPGSERLRYLIPFRRPEETIDLLAGFRSPDRSRLMVMADDGEKLGVWPETFHTVYEEGWLDRFFTLIDQNSEWLETTTFSECLAKMPPRGRVYLPTASYREMCEWALPTYSMKEYGDALAKAKNSPDFGSLSPFIKGGFWRNFLAKYPESNHMHKRMMMVSGKVHAAVNTLDAHGIKKKQNTARMLDHLYQSQCNDSYWHGVFGGLYLPHLRSAVYDHLIQAEYRADTILKGNGKNTGETVSSWLEIEQGDFDKDGSEEFMLNSELLNLFIDPVEGGRLTELDWKPRSFNLMNTLTRRREGYHDTILKAAGERVSRSQDNGPQTIHERVVMKEEGLQDHLVYDWYKRGSLLDHFLGSGVDLASFMKSSYDESGDFVLGSYGVTCKKSKQKASVVLERNGNVAGLSVRLTKELSLQRAASEITAQYEIVNQSSEELNTSFGSEFNITLLAGNAPDRYYDIPGHTIEKRNLGSSGETNNVKRIDLVDEWLKLRFSLVFSQPAVLWRAPVETISQSESGFERVFQSSMVMPLWRISLLPGKSWKAEMRITIH